MRRLPLFLILGMVLIATGVELAFHHTLLWMSKIPILSALAVTLLRR